MKIRILRPVSAHGGRVTFVDQNGNQYDVHLVSVAPELDGAGPNPEPFPEDAMEGGGCIRPSDRFSACITADGRVVCLEGRS